MKGNKRITLKKIWQTYPHRYNPKHKLYVDQKTFTDINKDFNLLLSKMIIQGHTFHLPSRGGDIRIKKFKSDRRIPDFKKTKELYGEENKLLPAGQKKVVYCTNKHSDGWAARWWWDKSKWWRFHSLYRFKATRTNNRELSRQIQDNNTIIYYYE